MRPTQHLCLTRARNAVVVAILCAPHVALAAASLSAGSATVPNSGDAGQICVSLQTNGEEVAGTQNDLVWDGTCATLPDESSCFAAGSHGKQLIGKLLTLRDFSYRALILSLSDVDPIDSGTLYCCNFVAEADPGQCCNISVTGTAASDSKGRGVDTSGTSGKLCVASTSAPGTPAPSPTATPTIEWIVDHGPTHDGCEVATPDSAARGCWLMIGAIAMLLRRHRGRTTRPS